MGPRELRAPSVIWGKPPALKGDVPNRKRGLITTPSGSGVCEGGPTRAPFRVPGSELSPAPTPLVAVMAMTPDEKPGRLSRLTVNQRFSTWPRVGITWGNSKKIPLPGRRATRGVPASLVGVAVWAWDVAKLPSDSNAHPGLRATTLNSSQMRCSRGSGLRLHNVLLGETAREGLKANQIPRTFLIKVMLNLGAVQGFPSICTCPGSPRVWNLIKARFPVTCACFS